MGEEKDLGSREITWVDILYDFPFFDPQPHSHNMYLFSVDKALLRVAPSMKMALNITSYNVTLFMNDENDVACLGGPLVTWFLSRMTYDTFILNEFASHFDFGYLRIVSTRETYALHNSQTFSGSTTFGTDSRDC